MGASAAKVATRARQRETQFHFATTRQHLVEIDSFKKDGVVASRSEALRRAWNEARAAKTAMFRDGSSK